MKDQRAEPSPASGNWPPPIAPLAPATNTLIQRLAVYAPADSSTRAALATL